MQSSVLNKFTWSFALKFGLYAGIIVLYSSIVGMMETFNEREVIQDTLTLGQLLLFGPILLMSFFVARRAVKTEGVPVVIASGVVVGLIASIPLIILIFISDPLDLRRVLVNVTPRLVRALTFDADELINGVALLLLGNVVVGAVGSFLLLLPEVLRRALLIALVWTLGIGVMGELVTLILRQVFERDTISILFARDVLRQGGAIGIFVIVFVVALFWSSVSGTIRSMYAASSDMTKRNTRYGGFTLLGVILLVLPWVLGSFLSEVTNNIGLYVMMALGLNIAVGLAGLLDLGYVTNFAVGAYIMGVLTSTGPQGIAATAGVTVFNFWLVIPIAILAAMLTGFLFAVPVLKMRGDYLAIATLGFGEIIGGLAVSDWFKPVIGGAQGILFVPKPEFIGVNLGGANPGILNISLVEPQQFYYIILAACVFMLYVSIRLNNSRIGRQWMSIREDEDVAAAMGIDVARSKLLAFTVSAASGGLAGAIFAAKVGTIFPNSFSVLVSINVLSIIIVGGMGSIPGIVLGAVVLIGLPELLREFAEYRYLLYGVLLVVIMLARPEGLWPSNVRRRELHEDEPPRPTDSPSPVVVQAAE